MDLPSVAYLPLMLWGFLLVAPSGSAYGAFDLATRIALMCSTALSTLAVPFFALIAGARVAEQQQHVRRLLDRFVPWMLLLAACGWVAFAVAGAYILQWWMPEAPRIKGEILMQSNPSDLESIEDCFTRSLACARRQGS